jgi:hypothetical protein
LVEDLRAGRLSDTVPDHGTLVRVRRTVGLQADRDAIKSERAAVSQEQAARAAAAAAATATEGEKKA